MRLVIGMCAVLAVASALAAAAAGPAWFVAARPFDQGHSGTTTTAARRPVAWSAPPLSANCSSISSAVSAQSIACWRMGVGWSLARCFEFDLPYFF